VLAAILSVLALGFGFALKPAKPLARDIVQPTITIFASRPGVSAVVTMNAYPYPAAASASPSATGTSSTGTGTSRTPAPPVPGYEFDIGLKVLSPRLSTLTFVLLLSDFPGILSTGVTGLAPAGKVPAQSAYSAVLPPPAQDAVGHSDYLALRAFVPLTPAAARVRWLPVPTVKIATQYSVVSRSSGSELQVAFPLVLDEKPGPVSPTQPISLGSLLGAYQPVNLSGYPAQLYEPNLESGNTQYRPGPGTNLTDYQTLAGTAPVVRPRGAWSWAGISDVSLLAQDALTADIDQEHLFWDGVAWGVAGAGGIAAVLEVASAIQEERKARRARKPRRRHLQGAGEPTINSGGGNELPAEVA